MVRWQSSLTIMAITVITKSLQRLSGLSIFCFLNLCAPFSFSILLFGVIQQPCSHLSLSLSLISLLQLEALRHRALSTHTASPFILFLPWRMRAASPAHCSFVLQRRCRVPAMHRGEGGLLELFTAARDVNSLCVKL